MNILSDVKALIIESGTIPATTVKLGKVPDQPNDVIVVIDSGGIEPDANDTTTKYREHRTFQIYVRATSYDAAQAFITNVRHDLIGRTGVKGNTYFEKILMISEFQSIGDDDTGRWEFTGNFKARVRAANIPAPGGGGLAA